MKRDATTNTVRGEGLHYVQAYIHSRLKGRSPVTRMPCARQRCPPKQRTRTHGHAPKDLSSTPAREIVKNQLRKESVTRTEQ